MGAAVSLMAEAQWRGILEDLESDAFVSDCMAAWHANTMDGKMKLMQLLEIANHPCLIRILPNGTHPDQGLIGAQRGLLTTLGNQLGQ